MKCIKCGGELFPPKDRQISLDRCPFCGILLLREEKAKSCTSFVQFLQYIVLVYKPKIYMERQRLVNLIESLYTGEERMKRVYSYAILDDSLSVKIYELSLKPFEEREIFYNQMIFSFSDTNFYPKGIGMTIVDDFVQGLKININYTTSKKYRDLLKKASLGDSKAQYKLGVYYEEGHGVKQSYEESAKWYRKSADQGDSKAQYKLGVYYEEGHGVKQSYEESAKWYRKSADQGDSKAQYKLGVYYEEGHGVKQSNEESAKWYCKSANQGIRKSNIN